MGESGGAVVWVTGLHAERTRFRLPRGSLGVFIGLSFRPHCGPGFDSDSNTTEYQYGRRVPRADKLTTFVRQLFRNSGTPASWSTSGLWRPVQGLLHIMQMESRYTLNHYSHNRRIHVCCVTEAKDENCTILVIMQSVVVISHFRVKRPWPLKMGSIDCAETSIRNYRYGCVMTQKIAVLI